MKNGFISLPLAAILSAPLLASEPPKFYSDDPLLVDDALVDVPVKPAYIELSDLYDRFGHVFKDWGASEIGTEASNVNTLDEVPDGPWFTNRHARRPMSLEELVAGPNQGEPPNPEETWTVFASKSQGLTPGFQVRDESGVRYFVKLDPIEVPELASAAEVIGTKIFYALGYHVPENYIVRIHPDRFAVAPGTQIEDSFGDKSTLTPFRFRRSIRLVPRLPDGRMRVSVSEYLPGEVLGPFRYYETRTDDPNDVVPHEDRRELRGLRLFAAWLNHDDTRAQNTQSSWVEENGRHHVRYYLIDFGSTLGSGSVDMQYANLSFSYWLDPSLVKKNLVGLGFHVPEYRKADWPDFPAYQAVGRIESELFDPAGWRNDYPNPAFVRMTARDAFWAAKILMRLTQKELAAIVETGEYSRQEDESYLLRVLVERQLKCGRFGINAINPLDEFELEAGALRFENLSEKYGFVESETAYEIEWSSFDNETGERRRLVERASHREPSAALPTSVASGLFLVASIRSTNADYPHWRSDVSVYLRPRGSNWEIVGVERESPPLSVFPMD